MVLDMMKVPVDKFTKSINDRGYGSDICITRRGGFGF